MFRTRASHTAHFFAFLYGVRTVQPLGSSRFFRCQVRHEPCDFTETTCGDDVARTLEDNSPRQRSGDIL
jgi:hypothetical protein